MNHAPTAEQLLNLARECLSLSSQERPELHWLKTKHAQLQTSHHLKNKHETDLYLYHSMYGRDPDNSSGILKIRYWRTGRHVPANRDQLLRFGKALELSPDEMKLLIQKYYNRSLDVYDSAVLSDPVYQMKYDYLKQITEAYLKRSFPLWTEKQGITPEKRRLYLRHLYFTDAFHYVHTSGNADIYQALDKHISSTRYDSEFSRQLKLLGEIPRNTMLRHLIILGLPSLTLAKLNEQLTTFGYLPLCEDHTLVTGEHLDWLLIHLFEFYEELLKTKSPDECLSWFQGACRTLDWFFIQSQNPRLQFMYFKALNL